MKYIPAQNKTVSQYLLALIYQCVCTIPAASTWGWFGKLFLARLTYDPLEISNVMVLLNRTFVHVQFPKLPYMFLVCSSFTNR